MKVTDTVRHRAWSALVGDLLAQRDPSSYMTCYHADRIDHRLGQPVTSCVRRSVLMLAFFIVCATPVASYAESLTLAWNASPSSGVTGYVIWYGLASGVYTNSVAVGNQTTATVTGLLADTRYYFAVKAVSAGGTSAFSNEADGSPFIDSTLTSGSMTTIRATHITELRTRIDALRVSHGIALKAWTDPVLTTGTPIRAVHINDLRSALNDVYVKLSMPVPTYTDPTIVVGVTVAKAAHITDLRNAVMALE